jgi:hypothetical protein
MSVCKVCGGSCIDMCSNVRICISIVIPQIHLLFALAGKGFAIASAAMVSLALFGGYLTNIGQETDANGHLQLNILEPFVFAGLLFGAMLPYWYVNMTCV